MTEQQQEIGALKAEITELRQTIGELRKELEQLRFHFPLPI
jgi:prefoldin subunit 5